LFKFRELETGRMTFCGGKLISLLNNLLDFLPALRIFFLTAEPLSLVKTEGYNYKNKQFFGISINYIY
jgi:hypothetical protein